MLSLDDMEGERYIQSVFRALKVVEYIAAGRSEVGLTEISKGVGLSKSTTHGLVSTLERCGYIRQNTVNGKYFLGLKFFELGQAYTDNLDLRDIAMPYLRELSERYQETVHLGVLSAGEVVYIDKVDGPLSIGIRSRIGGRNPAHCTGVGKVLLAGLNNQKIKLMYNKKKFQKYTENTLTNLEDILAELEQVRECGYACDREEFETGLYCIAAPIKDSSQGVTAAISLSGPAHRMLNAHIANITADLASAARKISAQMGFRER